MTLPSYWTCTEYDENCIIIKTSDDYPTECLFENSGAEYTEITKQEFEDRYYNLTNSPKIAQKMDIAPGFLCVQEGEEIAEAPPKPCYVHRGTITGRTKSMFAKLSIKDIKKLRKITYLRCLMR